jgi:hypothetical protein
MRNFAFPVLTLIILLSLPAAVQSQITQNWAKSVSASSASNAHIATDLSGNVYVAGNSSTPAYTLIKYNSAGTLQWSITGAPGTSGATGQFGVAGVATDNAGNAYLVSNGASAILVAAFNPSGVQLWATTLNTGGRGATANVMTVDGAGDVFIGGQVYMSTASSPFEYMTARVTGGVQKYLSTFEGSANQFSYVTGMTCDAAANAYVTGVSVGAHTYLTRNIGGFFTIRQDSSFDMTTIKYDSSGNALWTNVYNEGFGAADFGFSVAVDPTSGNVYAVGQTSSSTGLIGDLIAYSSTGSELWIDQSTTIQNNTSIVVDPSGNIITGGTQNFNISKYTSAGTLSWSYSNASISIHGGGFDGHMSMALDKSGNCYTTGGNSNNTEYFTAEITSAGGLAWTTTYTSGGSASSTGIAVYTPSSRFGLIVYPQINVTGAAANSTNFTTVQYNYHPVNQLGYNPETMTGLDNALPTDKTAQLFNFPNPFHGSTTISYTLANDSHVTLQVFDQSGKRIASLLDADQKAGTYTLPFTAARLAPGVYHYQVVATSAQGNFIQTKQMLIL